MRENRGPEARLREAAEEGQRLVERLPELLSGVGQAAAMFAEGGVKLHPDTLRRLRAEGATGRHWPLWLAILALALGLLLF
jgi:ubiquinone biosynthesis protein